MDPIQVQSDELPSEEQTIEQQLKQKNKELKSAQSKLTKIEEKYVKIFKENKQMKQQQELIDKILQGNFGEEEWKIKKIEDIQSIIESQKQQIMVSQQKANENQIKYETFLQKQLQDKQNNTEMKLFKKQISDLENVQNGLSKEIVELNDILQAKNDQILRLKKVEQEYTVSKAELLLKQLDHKNSETQAKEFQIEKSEMNNQIIFLKQQLEQAHHQIAQYQKKEEKILGDDKSTQTDFLQPKEKTVEAKIEKPILDNKSQLNQEYLKHVILKYMIYVQSGNNSQKEVLSHVIQTILNMNNEEKNMINEAYYNASYWNSAKNILNEGMACGGLTSNVNIEK